MDGCALVGFEFFGPLGRDNGCNPRCSLPSFPVFASFISNYTGAFLSVCMCVAHMARSAGEKGTYTVIGR